MIINNYNKFDPLETWQDVSWYYTWLQGIEGFQHCVCLVVILVKKEKIQLLNQEGSQFPKIGIDVSWKRMEG
jgi:hypothetical protein